MTRLQVPECGRHHGYVDTVQDGILGIVGTSISCLDCRLIEGGDSSTSPDQVGAEIARDDGQPWIEAPVPGEIGEGAPCPGKCLLHDIFCFVRFVKSSETEPLQSLAVLEVERLERLDVSLLTPLDQLPVSLDIDDALEAAGRGLYSTVCPEWGFHSTACHGMCHKIPPLVSLHLPSNIGPPLTG